MMTSFDPLDLDAVSACLHVARDLLIAQADKTRGPHKRRLEAIEGVRDRRYRRALPAGDDGRLMASRS